MKLIHFRFMQANYTFVIESKVLMKFNSCLELKT